MTFSTKLAYGAGDLGPAITANILAFFLLFFFTSVAGLNAGLAGSILMIGKVWDAINDPIVGILSDRTQSEKWGRRYPWILWGAIPFGLTFFLQWIVPQFDGDAATKQWSLFWYYVVVAILFNMFYTIVNLPYTALTPELTQDYNERTSLNSFRFAFSIGGSILSLVLALVIFQRIADPAQQYLVLGGICAILSTVPLYWCVFGTYARSKAVARYRTPDDPESINLAQDTAAVLPNWLRSLLTKWIGADWPQRRKLVGFLVVITNVPFLFVIGIYLFSWLAVQITATILPYFVVNCLGLSAQAFPGVAIAVQVTALLMLFVWNRVSARVGKKTTYFLGMGIWIIAQAGLFFLQPSQTGLIYLLAVMAGTGVSTAYLIPWSMIPDVIELDELRTGERREGLFYSFMVLLQKIGLALALFLVGQALDRTGFIETTAGQTNPIQPESALNTIRWAIGPIPTIGLIVGLILAYFYPITQEVHAAILLKLNERKQKQRNNPEL
jgi:glycoside/pentoside/hexuronide:cation symporter, GPH family